MDRPQLFLEQFLRDDVPTEFVYTPVERGPDLAGNTGATWTSPGSGGMSLGQFRDYLRYAREQKEINDAARRERLRDYDSYMYDEYYRR